MRVRRRSDMQVDEAVVFTNFTELTKINGFLTSKLKLKVYSQDNKGNLCAVQTNNGTLTAEKGDILLRTADGNMTILKPGYFRMMYEDSTVERDIQEEMDNRARISKVILDLIQSRGLRNPDKIIRLITRLANKESIKEPKGPQKKVVEEIHEPVQQFEKNVELREKPLESESDEDI